MLTTEAAWAAGLIDGEGCIFITRRKPQAKHRQVNVSYVLGVRVSMGHEATVRRLADLFDFGSVYTGCPSNPRANPYWAWLVQSRLAAEVLTTIQPYAVTKAVEIIIGLEFASLILAPRGGKGGSDLIPDDLLGRRAELWEQMSRVKPRSRFRS